MSFINQHVCKAQGDSLHLLPEQWQHREYPKEIGTGIIQASKTNKQTN